MNPLAVHLELLGSRIRQLEELVESLRVGTLSLRDRLEGLEERFQEEDFLVQQPLGEQKFDRCV